MAWKWFVQKDEVIEGPLRTEEVQARLQGGLFKAQHLIWGAGLEGWQSLQSWGRELPNLTLDAHRVNAPQTWHYAAAGQSYGPMERANLVRELKNLQSVGDVMIWTKGMTEWAPLFEFSDVLEEVGVNKRQFPRADLTGKAIIKSSAGVTTIAPLVSISEGGVGLLMSGDLIAGQNLTLEIQSPAFREVLHVKADVRYVSDGAVGLKFTQVSVEARGAIIQFIKQNQMRFAIKAA